MTDPNPELTEASASDLAVARAKESQRTFTPPIGADYSWVEQYSKEQYEFGLRVLAEQEAKATAIIGQLASATGLFTLGTLAAVSAAKLPTFCRRLGHPFDSRTAGDVTVAVEIHGAGGKLIESHRLFPDDSLKLRRHSPDGFNWGYGGSGSAQLALAIMLDATGSAKFAQRIYQKFKFAHVGTWCDEWSITSDPIMTWIASAAVLLDPRDDDAEEGGES